MVLTIDDLDKKLVDKFKGLVVKKDLVRQLKVGANVPVFVLEYLLANSCSTTDEEQMKKGVENVKNILQEHFVIPEQSKLIQSMVREKGTHKIIDKIEVTLDAQKDKYWAFMLNSNIKYANIKEADIVEHQKLMLGGIWAIIDVSYDNEIKIGNKIYPFVIDNIKPIQLSSLDEEKLKKSRSSYTKSEWKNILLRSMGIEPTSEGIDEYNKLLFISRLIPLVESNFNLIELGPRSTGKSFVYKEISPYAILLSGGEPTVAQLFINNNTKKIGLVGLWDTVAFDEVAGMKFKEKNAIQIMKDYMESGSFSRGGGGELSGNASFVFNGNINKPVETILKTSHLFSPLSEVIRNDTAFLDRIHFYLPGWNMPKLAQSNFTNHYGFSMDYFSEILKGFRKYSYADSLDKYFSLGSHLKQRDSKAVRKTVSGYIKLLHPDGNFSKDDIKNYLEIAMEMRRRVKEQLKKIGGMEFWDTNFSYIDKDSQDEKFISLPEERGSNLIEKQPLPPGLCYSASNDDEGLSVLRIETSITSGNGKLNISGVSKQEIKHNIKNVYQYIKANEKSLLSHEHSLSNYDISIQIINLLGNGLAGEIGGAVLSSILSGIYKRNLKSGLSVLGDITVGGGIERSNNFSDKVAMLSENGSKTVLVPIENLDEMQNLPASIIGSTDVIFYSNVQMLIQKAILSQ